MENGSYGFVSRSGTVHKAEFEWISDFGPDQIAVIKQNNKYGLLNAYGRKLLEPVYDQVLRSDHPVFIVVNEGSYGFFNPAGCFIQFPAYDFLKEKSPDFYTNGSQFRLLKKGEQAVVDANGQAIAAFGAFDDISLASCGLMRVKRKNKYGYVDEKLNLVIPCKYQQAGDFSDSLALVKLKENYVLINTQGKEVFSNSFPIEKISPQYYLINDDIKVIINRRGEVVAGDIASFQRGPGGVLVITLISGEIKLLSN
jgi:hypothetical protein